MTNGLVAGEKDIDDRVVRRSVQDLPEPSLSPPTSFADTIIWAVGTIADEFEPWGRNTRTRDRQLRDFIHGESMFASALATVASRNAAFSWTLDGPPRLVKKYQQVLENADFGRGWVSLMVKVSIDLYSQDNGAFIEVVRDGETPDSELIGLNHLDAARCLHTGAPEYPVIYIDRMGRYKLLGWWQVIPLAEMPVTNEMFYGRQLCALTRLLTAVQIQKNIAIYDLEKTGGRNTRAVHLLKGISATAVLDAIEQQRTVLDGRGNRRYSNPLVVSGVDPTADVGHDTLELASLPDNLDRETAMKWYIAQIAMAFLEDYQTFAPLPGGNLGTSTQSQILHDKARGRGPALFMRMTTHALNFTVLPDNVEFSYDDKDIAEEKFVADTKNVRATERATRVTSGEITPQVARQIALEVGDLTQEQFDLMGDIAADTDVTVSDSMQPEAQLGDGHAPVQPAQPGPTQPPAAQQRPGQPGQQQQPPAGQKSARDEAEQQVASLIDDTFGRLLGRLESLIQDESDGEE